jgi:hypothetical protein
MKKIQCLFPVIAGIIIFTGCAKENSIPAVIKQANVSKLILQNSGSVNNGANQFPFVINFTGVFQGTLIMSVSFTGGQKVHQFVVNWDGNIINDGDKKEIDLVVYQPDVNDQGTSTVFDSISANIHTLGITNEELNDPLLWIRVTNSGNAENTFFFKSYNVYVDPTSITYTRDVKVVNDGCSVYGLWGDLWLVTNDAGPVANYFVMATDNSISYTPAENDLLKIDFNYTYLTDSLKICPQLNQLQARPIKITKITK